MKSNKILWGIIWTLISILIILALGYYEMNAVQIRVFGERMQRQGNRDTAILAYQTVVEKYPFSYQLVEVRDKSILKKVSRLEDSLILKFGRFMDGYKYYTFPIFVTLVCCVLLFFTLLLKIFYYVFWKGHLFILFCCLAFFLFQLSYYGDLDLGNISRDIEELEIYPGVFYFLTYVLMYFTFCFVFDWSSPRDYRKNCEDENQINSEMRGESCI